MVKEKTRVDVETCRKCKVCGQEVLGTMAAIGHSRKHGPAVTKKTFDKVYVTVKNPSPKLIAKLKAKKEQRKTWSAKKPKKPKSAKKQKEEELAELLKSISPKLLGIQEAKINESGQLVIMTEIVVPNEFLASVILAHLS